MPLSFPDWFKTHPRKDGYKITPSYGRLGGPESKSNASDRGGETAANSLIDAVGNKGGSEAAKGYAIYHVCRDTLGHGPSDLMHELMEEQGIVRHNANPLTARYWPEPAQEAFSDSCMEARQEIIDTELRLGNVWVQEDVDGQILDAARRGAKRASKGLPWNRNR